MRVSKILGMACVVLCVTGGFAAADKPGPTGNTEANVFVENTLVRASVEDADGNYGIGTSSAHPSRPCETLLYGFGCGDTSSTSNIIVRVDGLSWTLMGLAGNCDGDATHVSTAVSGSSVVSSFTIPTPSLSIQVRHTPVSFDADTAAILVETTVTNNSAASHQIGVLYEYDTEIADIDDARIAAGGSFIDVETCFDNPTFDFWEAAENGFPPGATDLLGRGTLVSGGAVPPDRFGIGQWGDFWDICWDYICDGQSYGDSAVFMRWDPVTVGPAASRTVGTYYGVGAVDTTSGDLSISLSAPSALSCVNGSLSPNPFGLTAFVTNTTGGRCLDVTATLTLASGLTTTDPLSVSLGILDPNETDQGFWNVTATGNPCNADLAYSVEVTSSNCATNVNDSDVTVPCCNGGPTPTPTPTMTPTTPAIPTMGNVGILVLVVLIAAVGGILVAFRRSA